MIRVFPRLVFLALPLMVLVVAVYTAIWGSSGLVRRSRLQRDLDRVAIELKETQEFNARLTREVAQLRTDELTVRRAVAEELLLVPPGSTVYRFGP
jgi:cell division protein FtsB